MPWLIEAWRAADSARLAGASVSAVTVGALLGSFDWDSLGATALASFAASLSAGQTPTHPALAGKPRQWVPG